MFGSFAATLRSLWSRRRTIRTEALLSVTPDKFWDSISTWTTTPPFLILSNSLITRPTCLIKTKDLLSEICAASSSKLSICLSIYVSTALWLDLRLFFSFLMTYAVGRIPWTGHQPVARPLPTHRINAEIHPCLKWGSNSWSQRSSRRRQFMP
jgi:hypothetical protein